MSRKRSRNQWAAIFAKAKGRVNKGLRSYDRSLLQREINERESNLKESSASKITKGAALGAVGTIALHLSPIFIPQDTLNKRLRRILPLQLPKPRRDVFNYLSRSVRKTQLVRKIRKTIAKGFRRTLYHTTPVVNAPSILKEGLQAGKTTTFGNPFGLGKGKSIGEKIRQSGRIYLGRPLTVLEHSFMTSGKSKSFQTTIPSRFLRRDPSHLGSYVSRVRYIPSRIVKPISRTRLAIKSIPILAVGVAAGSYLKYQNISEKKQTQKELIQLKRKLRRL